MTSENETEKEPHMRHIVRGIVAPLLAAVLVGGIVFGIYWAYPGLGHIPLPEATVGALILLAAGGLSSWAIEHLRPMRGESAAVQTPTKRHRLPTEVQISIERAAEVAADKAAAKVRAPSDAELRQFTDAAGALCEELSKQAKQANDATLALREKLRAVVREKNQEAPITQPSTPANSDAAAAESPPIATAPGTPEVV